MTKKFHTTRIFPCYIVCLKLTAVKNETYSAYHIRKLFGHVILSRKLKVLQLVFPFFLIWSQLLSALVCFDVPIHGWLYVHSYWGFFQHQPGTHPMCDPNTNNCNTHWTHTINSRTYTEVALGCFNLGWVAWVAILKGTPPVMPCYIWCCSSMPTQNVIFTKMTLLVNQVDASTISSISGDVKCCSHFVECYTAGLF